MRVLPGACTAPRAEKGARIKHHILTHRERSEAVGRARGSDAAMISEIWLADLSFYQNACQAAKRDVPGADTIYDDLKERFPGVGGDPEEEPTPTPTPPTP